MIRRLGVGRAWVQGRWVDGDVAVGDDGRVDAVGVAPAGPRDRSAVPGLVDLQCNGVGGIDFGEASVEDVRGAAAGLAAEGVVAVTPTYFSLTVDGYGAALATLGEARQGHTTGAVLAGAHLEGPFLSPTWCGAHDPSRFSSAEVGVVERLLSAGPVHRMTLAPEVAGIDAVIERLVTAGVVVSIGHTDADAATCARAIDRGASMITHLFNAHRRFVARDPGPVGVALGDPRVTVSVIADGHHLADDTLRLTFAAAARRVVVVSDRVAVAPDRMAADGTVRTADGRLAGSAVSLPRSLAHLLAIGIDEGAAIASVSSTPARLIGWPDHDLRVGSLARAAILDDRWEVRGVVGCS